MNVQLAGILEPKKYRGGLPTTSPTPVTVQPVTVYGSYQVGTDVPASGYLLFNPYRGYNSIALAGPVADGQTVSFDSFDFESVTNNAVSLDVNGMDFPVALPNQPNVGPNLANAFELGRLASGRIKIFSNTISTTNVSLGGSICGASVSDLRNCGDFSVPAITAASTVAKDGISGVPIYEGLTTFVGPDVIPGVKPIDEDAVVTFGHAARQSFDYQSTAAGGTVGLFLKGFTQSPSPVNFCSVQEMEPCPWGADISVETRCTFNKTGTKIPNPVMPIIKLIWAQVSNVGMLSIIGEQISGPQWQNDLALSSGSPNFCWHSPVVRGRMNRTLIGVCVTWLFIDGVTFSDDAFDMNTAILFHDAYSEDYMGGTRIMRWDNTSTSQTIIVEGELAIEAVPTGAVAAYVKATTPRAALSLEPLFLLRAMFDAADSPLCRVIRNSLVYNMANNAEQYRAILEDPRSYSTAHRIASGMYAKGMYGMAGGFFQDIGSALGGTAGGLADDAIGSAVHSLFGAGRKRARTELGTSI